MENKSHGTAANAHAVKAELERLEGTWQLVSALNDGSPTPEDIVQNIRVVIQGGRHTVYFGEAAGVQGIPFHVDPFVDPKTTVDVLPDGQEIKGIYVLEGDTLTSCVAAVGQDRPPRFASEPGSGHTLRIFRRVNPV